MSVEIWNVWAASGALEARELFSDHFGIAPEGADLALLRRMIAAYSNLPYENLTKIIRKFTARSPEERLRGPVEVVSGFIERRTGGTCFSLTYCLGSMLSSAGLRCHPVMADMKRPNIHCALVVETAGRRYLVDPGYLVGEPVELAPREGAGALAWVRSWSRIEAAVEAMRDDGGDLVYVNLRDFDSRFGHRNDVKGFARALEELDGLLPALLGTLRLADLLLMTADHGCDPTDISTEHTREYSPIVVAGTGVAPGIDLGTRDSLADVSATVAAHLGVARLAGRGLLDEPAL